MDEERDEFKFSEEPSVKIWAHPIQYFDPFQPPRYLETVEFTLANVQWVNASLP